LAGAPSLLKLSELAPFLFLFYDTKKTFAALLYQTNIFLYTLPFSYST